MAHLLSAAGTVADNTSLGGVLKLTGTVLATITRFVKEVGRVPDVISSAQQTVGLWELHLASAVGLSQRDDINEHLRRVLQQYGVLGKAQECLERLNDIIAEAMPPTRGQTRLSELYDQAAFRLQKQEEVEGLLKQLGDLRNHLSIANDSSLIDAVQALQVTVQQSALTGVSDREADAIIDWLKPEFDPKKTDPFSMQIEKFAHQEPNTCTWLVESEQWKEWLKGGSDAARGCRRFICIYGLPGTGKTILASFLIHTLGPYESTHYYCLHERHRDETLPFLRWTVRELYKQLRYLEGGSSDRKIPAELRAMWQQKQQEKPRLMECLEILVGQFHSQHKKRVYIVVDAIDESEAPRDGFLEVLMTIGASQAFENVSLLVTSRPYEDMKREIDGLEPMTLPMKPIPIHSTVNSHDPSSQPPHQSRCDRSPDKTPTNFDGNGSVLNMDPQRSQQQTDRVMRPHRAGVPGTGTPHPNLVPGRRGPPSGETPPSPSKKRRGEALQVSPCTILEMDNPSVLQAIQTYVKKRLEKHPRFRHWSNPRDRSDVEIALARKAGGIFRTVACHLDMIARFNLTEPSQILASIETMPGSIFESYERILVEGIRDAGDLNKWDREFARTALTLICSDTSRIPDAEVLIEASRTILPQLQAIQYDGAKLVELLGCLVKRSYIPKPWSVFTRRNEDDSPGQSLRYSVAHYTVKEFLVSKTAAGGPAQYFAVSPLGNQRLELKIAFYGLQHFDSVRRVGFVPTRYEEYCLRVTEKALSSRPAIVEKEKEIWEAMKPCLRHNAGHTKCISHPRVRNTIKTHFPKWHSLNPFKDDVDPIGIKEATSVLVNLLILEWPELARIHLRELKPAVKKAVWRDRFKLTLPQEKSQTMTLVQMCVSRRHLDFLKLFTEGVDGARFRDAPDILFRAMNEPKAKEDEQEEVRLVTEELLKELIAFSADVNPKGFRVTPLQVATHALQPAWVRHLLASGAKVDAVGERSGVDPMSAARDQGEDPEWYRLAPLAICGDMEKNGFDGDQTEDRNIARRGVEFLLDRYLTCPITPTTVDLTVQAEPIVIDESD